MTAQTESKGVAVLFLKPRARWEWVINATPRALYRRLGELQGRSAGRKISPQPGFDPRNFQPVGSRYTD
jgi:hypothetical protein